MARIRTVKPDLFRHEELYEAEVSSNLPIRLAFAGLFTCCDREGRFRWKPRQLKLDILPYDTVDFEQILEVMAFYKFIVKYELNGEIYGYIPSWKRHQTINSREAESSLPDPDMCMHMQVHVEHMRAHGEGKGREGKRKRKRKGRAVCAEQTSCSPLQVEESPLVIKLPLVDKSEFSITQRMLDDWVGLYPAVDVQQELRNYLGWALANPRKRKTRSGILSSVNRWLTEKQNRGGSKRPAQNGRSPPGDVLEHNISAAQQWLEKMNSIPGEAIHEPERQ